MTAASFETHWHPNPPPAGAARSVGLLGGSFNPAHDGHRHIAEAALLALGLDEVWWLVSPQNPLKGTAGMADLTQRFASACQKATTGDPPGRMRVTDIEGVLGTRFTAETLVKLRQAFPAIDFVWLMGADNLEQLPEWKNWQRIFRTVPVAIFDRAPYSTRALAGAAAVRFARHRLPEAAARSLVKATPPAWIFVHSRLHSASASAIRAGRRAT